MQRRRPEALQREGLASGNSAAGVGVGRQILKELTGLRHQSCLERGWEEQFPVHRTSEKPAVKSSGQQSSPPVFFGGSALGEAQTKTKGEALLGLECLGHLVGWGVRNWVENNLGWEGPAMPTQTWLMPCPGSPCAVSQGQSSSLIQLSPSNSAYLSVMENLCGPSGHSENPAGKAFLPRLR